MSEKTLVQIAPSLQRPGDLLTRPNYFGGDTFRPGEGRHTTIAYRSPEEALFSLHTFLAGSVVEFNISSSPFPIEISVDQFGSVEERMRLAPPLLFVCDHDEETNLYELDGKPPYDGVLLYGESVKEVIDMLEQDVLPMFWEDCKNAEKLKLSPGMLKIVTDLKERAKP